MLVHHRAAAEPDDARAAAPAPRRQRGRDRLPLQPPELRLAVGDEDVADRLARDRLDDGVGIGEADPEPRGQQRRRPSSCRLPADR